jgi:predicted ATP-dependent endonuclease of OLD family
MVVSSPSNLQSANGIVWQRLQQQQAERTADQAEQKARALKGQAQQAEGEAARAEENARSLQVEATQANQRAGEARQSLASLKSLEDVQGFLQKTRAQIADSTVAGAAAKPEIEPSKPPVVNADGQKTGTLVNVTA